MTERDKTVAALERGDTYLGLELGSTRIKAVLIDGAHMPIASGSHTWENKRIGGLWTYSLDDIWAGLQDCYKNLAEDVLRKYGVHLSKVGAVGFSGMMHGYMAFDAAGSLLTPFRTWRNTTTGRASALLTEAFGYNIPQRWSIAHLYQAMLDGEPHLSGLSYLTTLAGYIHWSLTGQKLVGVGEASGMFPIDTVTGQFDARMTRLFDALIADKGYTWTLESILPRVLPAGESAGFLTEEGARLLDPSGTLRAAIPVCPPEGDAGTGMVATDSVARYTGNISAGTSIFAMIVLDKPLSKVYPEIDLVTTPSGELVAMVHCNNGTGDLDAWVELFGEAAKTLGAPSDKDTLYGVLYGKALDMSAGSGGLMAYNYLAGEPVTDFSEGRPLFVRSPDSRLTLAGFMRTHLFSALGSLKLGMDILKEGEQVHVRGISGHGGFFKIRGVGQRLMASALGLPVTVMETAGEGGPWGMAILAAYMVKKQPGETLEAYLKTKVFSEGAASSADPEPQLAAEFDDFMQRYKKGLAIERAAVETL